MQAGAADASQADIVRERAKSILRLNPWLASMVGVQSLLLFNRRTESKCEILPADIPGSQGKLPDFLLLNELSHIGKREFAENLMDNAEKNPHGVALVCTNAGFLGSWQEEWRKNAME